MADRSAQEASFAAKVFEALKTWLAKVRDAVMAAWNQHQAQPNPAAVASTQPLWDRLLAGLEDELRKIAAGESSSLDQSFVDQQLQVTRSMLSGIPDEVQQLIHSEIATAVSQGDAPDAIARRIDLLLTATGSPRWKNRAKVIAVTELHRMANAATQAAAMTVQRLEHNGNMTKTWIAHRDERTREDHRNADEQTVPLNGAFRVGTSNMLYPGDPKAPAEQVVNCRCSMKIQDGN
jgi:hypothetical protein